MDDKMIFDNVKILKVNGKEVKSIITLDGKLIYHKDYVLNTNNVNIITNYSNIYNLSSLVLYFTDNTDIVEAKLTLPTATTCYGMFWGCSALTDIKLNLPRIYTYTNMFYNCSNLETIDVTIPTSSVSDFKSYINSLNLKHLTSLVINGDQYISEICLAYDKGISANHSDIWDITQCTLTRGAEYSEISETTEYGFIRTKQANAIPKDCIIEFDYMNVDGAMGNNMFAIYSSENQYITIINFLYLGNLSIGAWHHVKIKIENGLMTVTNNTNSTVYTLNLTIPTEKILFLFLTPNETTKARFKNFEVYPV